MCVGVILSNKMDKKESQNVYNLSHSEGYAPWRYDKFDAPLVPPLKEGPDLVPVLVAHEGPSPEGRDRDAVPVVLQVQPLEAHLLGPVNEPGEEDAI